MTEMNATLQIDNAVIKEKAGAAKDAVVDLAGEAKRYAAHCASDAKDTACEWARHRKE